VSVVSSVHPQSPAAAKLKSEGATCMGLEITYRIAIAIIKETAEIMTKNLFNYVSPVSIHPLCLKIMHNHPFEFYEINSV
jgi:hypothetical protein